MIQFWFSMSPCWEADTSGDSFIFNEPQYSVMNKMVILEKHHILTKKFQVSMVNQ